MGAQVAEVAKHLPTRVLCWYISELLRSVLVGEYFSRTKSNALIVSKFLGRWKSTRKGFSDPPVHILSLPGCCAGDFCLAVVKQRRSSRSSTLSHLPSPSACLHTC